MHFPTQKAFVTDVPSIYHPHDLQHLHLPEFFTPREHLVRETTYRAFCAQARMVAAASSWVKRDIVGHYVLPADKVQVVPLAPVLPAYPQNSDTDVALVAKQMGLPDAFAYYPAQTWPHKNHIGLLEAMTILRDQYQVTVKLVASGHLNQFFAAIRRRVQDLHLGDQVQFLGVVTPQQLVCLYKLCRCVVIPTSLRQRASLSGRLFWPGPPWPARMSHRCLEEAGDAALLFDPDKPEQIADAIYRLWTSEPLRATLSERGRLRVAQVTWDRTVRLFRAHYRRISGSALSEDDALLLGAPPIF